jgi:hypothetical protein
VRLISTTTPPKPFVGGPLEQDPKKSAELPQAAPSIKGLRGAKSAKARETPPGLPSPLSHHKNNSSVLANNPHLSRCLSALPGCCERSVGIIIIIIIITYAVFIQLVVLL